MFLFIISLLDFRLLFALLYREPPQETGPGFSLGESRPSQYLRLSGRTTIFQ